MSDQNPLVTIYIPTYNRVDLLKRAVESVRNQTYTNLEIIIVDDCSTDETHQYLKEVSNLDKRIRYFIKEKNSGACVSRNIAIENASGEYITGLDDDDYFLNRRIESFVEKISWLEEYKFLFSNMKIEKNKVIKLQGSCKPNNISFEHLLYANYVGNQIFCKTSDMQIVGGFDESLKAWQDIECWMNFVKNLGNGKLVNNFSYILDNNDHLRITNQNKKNKIKIVFNHILKKYQFKNKESKVFAVNLIPYGIDVPLWYGLLTIKLNHYFSLWFWKRFILVLKNKLNVDKSI